MNRQINELKRGVNVVIATPGRLQDHIERGTINLSRVETLILDESDRMLDMGFLPAIRKILNGLPEKRQTLLFSATFPIRSKHLLIRLWMTRKLSRSADKIERRKPLSKSLIRLPRLQKLLCF